MKGSSATYEKYKGNELEIIPPTSSFRSFSTRTSVPENYPHVSPTGTVVGTSNRRNVSSSTMAAEQNNNKSNRFTSFLQHDQQQHLKHHNAPSSSFYSHEHSEQQEG